MTIEKGIPVPPRSRWERFALTMEPGDSVVMLTDGHRKCLLRVLKAMGWQYTSRKMDDGGFRVWRTQ